MKLSKQRLTKIRQKLFKLYPDPKHPMRVQWKQYKASCHNDDGGNSTEHWKNRKSFLLGVEAL